MSEKQILSMARDFLGFKNVVVRGTLKVYHLSATFQTKEERVFYEESQTHSRSCL